MDRPTLRSIPVEEAVASLTGRGTSGVTVVTMREQQWDSLLATAYAVGWTLLELDADERPVRAYRKADV